MGTPNSRKKVSLRDIAKEVGLSVSAVSLAMRNSSKVSPERRKEVLDTAERLGYKKDGRIVELMEHLRTKRDDRLISKVAVLVPEIKQEELKRFPFIRRILDGLEEQAEESGYGLDVIYLEDLKASPKRLKGILTARGIKGVIAVPWVSGVGSLKLDLEELCVATAGYSIIEPMLNRACTNYLQMMDELIEQACRLGYKRIGFIMTYTRGGIGHKLFASSFLFYSMLIEESQRIPILPRRDICEGKVKEWMDTYKPDVVISSEMVRGMLADLGYDMPKDLGFASIDIAEGPDYVSGVDHRHELVGREALKLAVADVNLNKTGLPENPKVVTVDSHYHSGETLRRVGEPIDIKIRSAVHNEAGE
ncbi:LacI family DNA-binding transcriptional regulator [Pelagicoccus mobilis]|uniref:LacI family DNA-binding transcriptional regulator n=1 Tax=Pelagicoccus mobilis TaxID=415221 RepID=A0A934S659_9BACT|nr:LacI family DNA-binding transcriptional regulator [Pelagicoccus mobilis]MBK1880104.1 LacI family DNA-binding transcriptional regulator [Pelagicoccus mobilis]